MKIAIAQTEIMFEQPEENLANAAAWIAQAAAAQADCIVFPEMSFTGFSMQVEKIAGYAPKIHEKMWQLAVQCGIAIGYGWTSQKQHGKGENHYTLLDKNGGVLSDYVKIHPFSYGGEDRFYHSGEKLRSGHRLRHLLHFCHLYYSFPDRIHLHPSCDEPAGTI